MQYERLKGPSVPDRVVIVSVWKNHGSIFADVACTGCTVEQRIVAEFPKPLTSTLERASALAEECGLSRIVIAATDDALWGVVEDRLSRLWASRRGGMGRVQQQAT